MLANKDKAANDIQIIFINRTVYKSVQSSEYDAGDYVNFIFCDPVVIAGYKCPDGC
jgi:hypothetical protein